MQMIVMRAMTMGMKMPVLFAMVMPVRMEMDTLSPECKSHRQSKADEHHSHCDLEQFRPGRWDRELEKQDGRSDYQ